jgi:hypothetical protein
MTTIINRSRAGASADSPNLGRPTRWCGVPQKVLRAAVALALGTVALGACAASNTPTSYNDVTSNNFITSCTAAGMTRPGCEQTYTAMSAPDGMPFDTFKAIDQQLAKDPTQMPTDLETFLVSHPTTTDKPNQ